MAEHREKSQLFGDALRELGVLIIALYPLDAYLQGKFDWWNFLLIFLFGLALLWWGIILEGRDEL